MNFLDREIEKYEESAKGWQLLKDHGNHPEESDPQIKRALDYSKELQALKEEILKDE